MAVTAAAYPRVRKIARVAATSVAAREAQLSRLAELEDRVAEAYRVRVQAAAHDELTPRLLAELTLSILDVTFREWFKQDGDDILPTTNDVFAALQHIVCEGRGPAICRPAARRGPGGGHAPGADRDVDRRHVRRYLTGMVTRISSKGQIVLPAELRQIDGIEPGQEFEIERIDRGNTASSAVLRPPMKARSTGLSPARRRAISCRFDSESTDTL